jgi:hypothetical protein
LFCGVGRREFGSDMFHTDDEATERGAFAKQSVNSQRDFRGGISRFACDGANALELA